MEREAGEWPATRWRLTAPESYVLQAPKRLSSVEAFKLALRELVLRKALAVEPVEAGGLLGRRKRRSALRDGPQLRSMAEPALTPLLALYGHAQRSRLRTTTESHAPARDFDGVLVEDLARAARDEFTRSFAGYIDRHVYPSLAKRGLIRPEEYKRFGLFARRHQAFTPAGREAAYELEQWLRVGAERLSGWVREDPARALAYAGGAGTAVLLMTSLYPDLDLLGEHVRERTASGAEGAGGGDWPGDGTEEASAGSMPDAGADPSHALGDLGALDFSGLELDFGAFEGIDSAFGALGAGVDAGAGVGGDGGGGGGGNGGGG
jgi:hypothetical protein